MLQIFTFVKLRRAAAFLNHPMQPSGEVGRFEVDDQPSPPVDRYRYPTECPWTLPSHKLSLPR